MAVSGRFVALMLVGVAPVALWPGWVSLLGWLAFACAVAGLDIALAVSPRAVQLQRLATPTIRLGSGAQASIQVVNPTSGTLRAKIRDAWQPSAGATPTSQRLTVPGRDARILTTQLQPTRRGDRRSDFVTIRSFGPLRIAARQRSLPCYGSVRVIPPFESRRHLPSRMARLRELDGTTRVQIRGQGTEFDSLRDYVVGDDVRSIDWRATARRQQVVVRTWRPERDRRVLLVVDTSRTSAARVGDLPRLDAAIDAALLMAATAAHAGDRVELLAMDRWVRAQVQGVTGAQLLPKLVNALAPIEAALVEADWTSIAATIHAMLTQRALVVLLTSVESAAAVEEGLLPVLPNLRHHQIIVASVSDPQLSQMAGDHEDATAVYQSAAAQRAEIDRGATTAELSRAGVSIVQAPPDQLPVALTERYLALKAAGKL